MQVRELITRATQILQANKGIDSIKESTVYALSLVAHGLGLDKTSLYMSYDNEVTDEKTEAILRLVNRKASHEPIEYVTGKVNFMGFEFLIKPPVFIPRPETEVLVETVVELAKGRGGKFNAPTIILDIGTGCGAIGIALLKFLPTGIVYAVDIIDLGLAKLNAIKHMVNDRINFIRGNLLTPFKFQGIRADFIVSNPPYIPTAQISSLQPEIRLFEAHSALDGGEDGLVLIRKLIRETGKYLKPDGTLLLELSPEQENAVREEAMRYFDDVRFVKDFCGQTRILVAKVASEQVRAKQIN